MHAYNHEGHENTLQPEDFGKILSFETERVHFHFDKYLDNGFALQVIWQHVTLFDHLTD